MENKNKFIDFTFIVTCLLCLLPVLVGLILWQKLPDQMVRHFAMSFEPNGWASKTFMVFIAPVFMLLLNIIVNVCVCFEVNKKQRSFSKFDIVMRYSTSILTSFALIAIYIYNIHQDVCSGESVFAFIMICCGILYFFLGNYLPKAKDLTGFSLPGISRLLTDNEQLWFKVKRTWGYFTVILSLFMISTAYCHLPFNIIFFMACTLVIAFLPYILVLVFKDRE